MLLSGNWQLVHFFPERVASLPFSSQTVRRSGLRPMTLPRRCTFRTLRFHLIGLLLPGLQPFFGCVLPASAFRGRQICFGTGGPENGRTMWDGKSTEELSCNLGRKPFPAEWSSPFFFPSISASLLAAAQLKGCRRTPSKIPVVPVYFSALLMTWGCFSTALPLTGLQGVQKNLANTHDLSYMPGYELPGTYGRMWSKGRPAATDGGKPANSLSTIPAPSTQPPIASSGRSALSAPSHLEDPLQRAAEEDNSSRTTPADAVWLSERSRGSDSRARSKSTSKGITGSTEFGTLAISVGSASADGSSSEAANDAEAGVENSSFKPPMTTLSLLLCGTSTAGLLSRPKEQQQDPHQPMESRKGRLQQSRFRKPGEAVDSSNEQQEPLNVRESLENQVLMGTGMYAGGTSPSDSMIVDLRALALSRCVQFRSPVPPRTPTDQHLLRNQSEASQQLSEVHATQNRANPADMAFGASPMLQFLSVDWLALSRKGSHTPSPAPSAPSANRHVRSREEKFLGSQSPPIPASILARGTDCTPPEADCPLPLLGNRADSRTGHTIQQRGLAFPGGAMTEAGLPRQRPGTAGQEGKKSATPEPPFNAHRPQESFSSLRAPTGTTDRGQQLSSVAAKLAAAAQAEMLGADNLSSERQASCPRCGEDTGARQFARKGRWRLAPMPERRGTVALLRCVQSQNVTTAKGTQQKNGSRVPSGAANAAGDEGINEEMKLVEDDLFGFIPVQLHPASLSSFNQNQGALRQYTSPECNRASVQSSTAQPKHGHLSWTAPEARRWFETVLLPPGREDLNGVSHDRTDSDDGFSDGVPRTSASGVERLKWADDQQPSEQAHQHLSATAKQSGEVEPLELPVWILEVPLSEIVDTERLDAEEAACPESGTSARSPVHNSDGDLAVPNANFARDAMLSPHHPPRRAVSAFWHPTAGRLMEAQLYSRGLLAQCILSRCRPHEDREASAIPRSETRETPSRAEPQPGSSPLSSVFPAAECSRASRLALLRTVRQREDSMPRRPHGNEIEPGRSASVSATGRDQTSNGTQTFRHWLACSCDISSEESFTANHHLQLEKTTLCFGRRFVPVCVEAA